ncbi:putative protein kinase RLK-Pelle-DLSV family [Rosa chinensis]|uniref:Receptor-like serine/threonine-protein kinase n=1 Tax=Rosa chinensis TaxID=74649 RepID=A0A2P6S2L9_ROSCH|nr:G-type lectin S-receptor-like serine/threonine-protein kinase At1g11330 isoform X1 [Rosa chinensis]PRQ52929.1 putative protein kinase RLK-Pelle-DLSV family [Rosa chinensis]
MGGWLFLSIVMLLSSICSSQDTIIPGKSISANQTLISSNGTFGLGFFSPQNSTKFFLGIWYNTIPHTASIVWVANRESPLDSPGFFALRGDGNLVVLDGTGKVLIWSSNASVASSARNATTGFLMNNGNLVLRFGKGILWQSFDHPSDTLLPEMKVSLNKRSGQQRCLTSWAALDDPHPGKFTLGFDPKGLPGQAYIWKENAPYWRSGTFFGKETKTNFGISTENSYFLTYNFDANEDYLTYGVSVSVSPVKLRALLDPTGQIVMQQWLVHSRTWYAWWREPVHKCDFYAPCGPYGACDKNESLSSPCKCLTGFIPKFQKQWAQGDWAGGCVREKPLTCDTRSEGFSRFEGLKLPDHAVLLVNKRMSECESQCYQNCSCTAYAYLNETGENTARCLTWFGDLIDLVANHSLGKNIFIRVHRSNQAGKGHSDNSLKVSLVIVIASAIAGLIILTLGYFLGKKFLGREYGRDSIKNVSVGGGKNNIELPHFGLRSILVATNNFSEANKLGEGGFGPVYKGILTENQEVAIKRLSTKSGQGHQEFMNELKLISKLQHTNLVRLLGCCIEEEERLLMYEYMPNRSLDKFLFDPSGNSELDWNTRFRIIEGIAQGVLYIHKYSRLKIIHRDLKASNILLDGTMNPKISDFGMAKIFDTNQTEANTNRIVGTYGYMSPEYALYGHFSDKLDVFSFGVLLLEIVSGRKNAIFHHFDRSLTLAGWVWELWKEGRGVEVIDASIRETCQFHEALRCIHVGLLCVQQAAADRPTMSSVILMLQGTGASSLPPSNEPAFSTLENANVVGSSTRFSNNEITNSLLEAR